MNQQEHATWRSDAWRSDALEALMKRYSAQDANVVIEWFDSIKGDDEYSLTGYDYQEYLRKIRDIESQLGLSFDLYGSLMNRLWHYAPLIIAEHRDHLARGLPI